MIFATRNESVLDNTVTMREGYADYIRKGVVWVETEVTNGYSGHYTSTCGQSYL